MKTSNTVMMARAMLIVTMITVFGPPAAAGELNVPKAHPEIAMDIPDGWNLETSATGFEMRSPEKNSIVIGRTLGRDKVAVDTWRKEAAEKLEAFGVKFDPTAKAPPPKPAATLTPLENPQGQSQDKPEEKSADKSVFTTDPNVFTFTGAPSLKTPGTAGSNDPVKPGALSVESLTGFGATVENDPVNPNLPKLPFRAVLYYGATMNGKPVDVQLLIYSLPANRLFVMMQESGSDDGRAVAMARSVRATK